VRLRAIEGQPVVTKILSDSVARATGIRIGDVVLAVDGERVADRLARLRPVTSASTPQALQRSLVSRLPYGPDSSRVTLSVRGADRRIRRVTLPRERRFIPESFGDRTGPIIRRFPGNIGYADLDRLEPGMVDSMFKELADTRVIIFDNRGYPQGTAWTIAPRLTPVDHLPVARFSRMQPMLRDTADHTIYSFVQTLPSATGPRYRGRTVMLIDERTQSQAEHTGLFFRTANRTTFIGSPTAGANGDVAKLVVPGGISLWFSGQAVTWMNGSQLQRVGLKPDVTIRPTIEGIRAGRDEVLEGALAWVRRHIRAQVR
jgi:C-terminal processing protease CtpA/Prc